MNIFYKITILLFASGITAALAQVVLAREIANQIFLTSNLIFFIALSWIAGAVLAFQSVKNKAAAKNPERELNFTAAILPVINAFYITGSVILIRYFKTALKLGPENNAPDWAAMILCGVIFIPIAFMIFSSVFALMEALRKGKALQFIFASVAAVLAGIAAGAVFYALWAVKHYINLDVVYTLGIFNLAVAYLFFRDRTMEGRWLMLSIIGALIIYLGFNMAGLKQKVDDASSRALYSGYTIIAQKEFATVNFCMTKKDEDYSIFENGTLAYKMPDPKYPMIAKMAKGPRVLVINGGLTGLIDVLSKNNSVSEMVCVEADPYIAVVLEKTYKNYIHSKDKIEYISAQGTSGIADAVKNKGKFNTIIINPRLQGHMEGKYYFSPGFKAAMDKMLDKDGQIIYGGN